MTDELSPLSPAAMIPDAPPKASEWPELRDRLRAELVRLAGEVAQKDVELDLMAEVFKSECAISTARFKAMHEHRAARESAERELAAVKRAVSGQRQLVLKADGGTWTVCEEITARAAEILAEGEGEKG